MNTFKRVALMAVFGMALMFGWASSAFAACGCDGQSDGGTSGGTCSSPTGGSIDTPG